MTVHPIGTVMLVCLYELRLYVILDQTSRFPPTQKIIICNILPVLSRLESDKEFLHLKFNGTRVVCIIDSFPFQDLFYNFIILYCIYVILK